MELTHLEALAVMAGLNRLSDAIADDASSIGESMREAVQSAKAKLIKARNIDAEWRK